MPQPPEQDLCGGCQQCYDLEDLQPHGFCLHCERIARIVWPVLEKAERRHDPR